MVMGVYWAIVFGSSSTLVIFKSTYYRSTDCQDVNVIGASQRMLVSANQLVKWQYNDFILNAYFVNA